MRCTHARNQEAMVSYSPARSAAPVEGAAEGALGQNVAARCQERNDIANKTIYISRIDHSL